MPKTKKAKVKAEPTSDPSDGSSSSSESSDSSSSSTSGGELEDSTRPKKAKTKPATPPENTSKRPREASSQAKVNIEASTSRKPEMAKKSTGGGAKARFFRQLITPKRKPQQKPKKLEEPSGSSASLEPKTEPEVFILDSDSEKGQNEPEDIEELLNDYEFPEEGDPNIKPPDHIEVDGLPVTADVKDQEDEGQGGIKEEQESNDQDEAAESQSNTLADPEDNIHDAYEDSTENEEHESLSGDKEPGEIPYEINGKTNLGFCSGLINDPSLSPKRTRVVSDKMGFESGVLVAEEVLVDQGDQEEAELVVAQVSTPSKTKITWKIQLNNAINCIQSGKRGAPAQTIKQQLQAYAEKRRRTHVLNSDVTIDMAGQIIDIRKPEGCTLPELRLNDLHRQLTWHYQLLNQVEAWMEYVLSLGIPCPIPPPPLFRTEWMVESWWWCAPTSRLMKIIALRYGAMPITTDLADWMNTQVSPAALNRARLDPFFAPWWAVNWRTRAILQIMHGAFTMTGHCSERLLVPLDSLVSWINREIEQNNLLIGEVTRVEWYQQQKDNDSLDGAPWYDVEEYTSFVTTKTDEGKVVHVSALEQPIWILMRPERGCKGQTWPPTRAHKPAVEVLYDGYFPKLDNWSTTSPPFVPAHRFWQDTPDPEDEKIAATHYKPLLYYDPVPTDVKDEVPPLSYLLMPNIGRGSNWPAALSTAAFANTGLGQHLLDVRDLGAVVATGTGKPTSQTSWCLITERPPGVPTANMITARPEDKHALARGCNQCGARGAVRYMVNPGQPTIYVCPFCSFQGDSALIYDHLDKCEHAEQHGWQRNAALAQFDSPPLYSTNCGHVFCQDCANVSQATKPPCAFCMACGARVSAIAEAEDYRQWILTKADPGTGRRQDKVILPELFTSGNLLAHHR